MNDFVKTIKIKFNIDEASSKKLDLSLADVSKKFDLKSISKSVLSAGSLMSTIGKTFSSDMSGDTHLSNSLKSFTKGFSGALNSFSKGFKSGISDISAKFLSKLGSLMTDALDEMDNMLRYSQLTDAGIRETKFSYGFSSSQAYGFDKAKSMLGISSDEDLMYMNNQQQQQFRNAFIKYSEKYTKLADDGFFEKMQEYNVEMEEFKEDLKLNFVEWFMNNKDSIKLTLDAIMSFTQFTMTALSWLLKYFGQKETSESEKSARISDVINNYSSSRSNVVTVTNNNTYNGVNDGGKSMFERSAIQNIEQIKSAIVNGL